MLGRALWFASVLTACGPRWDYQEDPPVAAADGAAAPSFPDAAPSFSLDGASCAAVAVTVTSVTPTVLLTVDRSGSMGGSFPGSSSRWTAVYQTLMSTTSGIVMTLQDEVRFGLALYTDGSMCPDLRGVPPALHNYAAINSLYAANGPGGDTPTGEAIRVLTAALVAYAEPGPKVIVLATDGLPDTCANGDTNDLARLIAVQAVQSAWSQGISTYVISVGPDVAQDHLQDLANAGAGLSVGGAANAPYYRALDATTLVDAFEQVIGGVRSCTFTLNGTVDPDAVAEGQVSLDGTTVPADQWRLPTPTTLELVGAACASVMGGGDHEISAAFPCDAVEID